jgi:hypothetical protein
MVLALVAGLFIAQAPIAQAEEGCVTLKLLDQYGNGVAGGKAQPAYGGSWGPELSGQTGSNGELYTCELVAGYTKIKMAINQSSEEQTPEQLIASDYTWYTVPIIVELRDYQNNLITDNPGGGSVDQGGGAWVHLGYTGDASPYGQYIVQVFGNRTFKFRMGYNHTSQVIDQFIPSTGGTITFQTGRVTINCAGTVQLALGGSWYSYPSGTVLQLLPGTYNFRGACGTGSITVTAGSQGTIPIITNQPPTADAGEDKTICEGSSVQLDGSASGGTPDYTYSWSPTTDLDDPNIATPNASPTTTTTYTLTVTDANTCTDTDTVTVTVVAGCTATAPSFSICQDTTVNDDLFTSNGAQCSENCTMSLDYSFNGSQTGQYPYTVICSNGPCSDNATGTVTVNPSPTVNITGNTTICQGSSTTLTANASGGTPPYSYLWSTGETTENITVSAAGPYSVTVTDSANCRGVVVSDNNTMVTQGNGTTPHNAVLAWEPGQNYPNDGPDDSTWAANSLWDSSLTGHSFSASGADWIWESYRVVHPAAGDVVTFERSFYIPGNPTSGTLHITCDNGYEVYLNGNPIPVGSAQLSPGWGPGHLTLAYVDTNDWQSVESYPGLTLLQGNNLLEIKTANEYMGPDDGQQNDGTVGSNPAGLIYELVYEYTDGCGCSDKATGTVTVNALPNVDAGNDQQVCEGGDPIDLDNTGVSPTGGIWSGTGVSGSQFVPDALAPGAYSIMYSYTDNNGCSNSDNKTVTVVEACEATAPPFSICQGTTVDADLFTSKGAMCSGTCTMTLDFTGVDSSVLGDHTYTVTCSNGVCENDVATGQVTVNTPPSVTLTGTTTFCQGNSTTITANVSNGQPPYTYNWTNSTAPGSPGSDNTTYIATNSGIVAVTVTDDNGCTGSDNITVTAIFCGGGGGGGGGSWGSISSATAACPLSVTVNMLGEMTTARMTFKGVLCEDCLASDPTGQNSWEAKEGTQLLCAGNIPPQLIELTLAGSPPPPINAAIVGPIYDFTAYTSKYNPSPLTISPEATLALAYDPNKQPENISALTIAYYDENAGKWVEMETAGYVAGGVEVPNVLATHVTHLAYFAVLAKLAAPTPAKFEVSNLTVSPSQAQLNQEVAISVNVANTGGTSGSYSLELTVNGISKSTKQVTVAAGTSQTVNFTITGDAAGKHQVEIAGLAGEFEITKAAKQSQINWWLIGGITGIILLIIIGLVVRRRQLRGY